MASAERIFLILDTTESLPRFASSGDATEAGDRYHLENISEITLADVSFGYVEDEIVLRNIFFSDFLRR